VPKRNGGAVRSLTITVGGLDRRFLGNPDRCGGFSLKTW
jgi:hypothetical protein